METPPPSPAAQTSDFRVRDAELVFASDAVGATRIIGVYSWVLDRGLLEASGIEVYHRSWAVVAREGRGAMRAITRATVADPAGPLRFTECVTQIANEPIHRAYRQLGVVRGVHPVYVLHAWTAL